jgi:4a-hydroxytetrahydrobiopterin dehydratase
MEALKEMRCEACQRGAPTVTPDEMPPLLAEIPNWQLEDEDGVPRLSRTFKFPDFAAALAFTNRVAALAEEQQHHPLLITEWGRVTVKWWTHKIRGLHKNDFIMAAKTDDVSAAS